MPERKRWRLEYVRNGKRHRPTFPTKEKAEAEFSTIVAEEKSAGTAWTSMPEHDRMDLMLVLTEVKTAGLTVRKVWEGYKRGAESEGLVEKDLKTAVNECITAKLGSNRRRVYVDKLEWLLKRFIAGRETQSVASMRTTDVENFIAGKTAVTRKTYISQISALFSFCVRRNYIRQNPCDRLEQIILDRKPPIILTLEQCRTALEWTQANDPAMLAWIVLTLLCGLRPESEADHIAKDAVNIDRGIVTVDLGKIRGWYSARRIVPLTEAAKAWFTLCDESEWKMPHDKRRFRLRKLRKALGFTKWPQDILRHTCASYLLAAEKDAGKVASFLGNSASVVLNHYKELVPHEEGLAFKSLIPK